MCRTSRSWLCNLLARTSGMHCIVHASHVCRAVGERTFVRRGGMEVGMDQRARWPAS